MSAIPDFAKLRPLTAHQYGLFAILRRVIRENDGVAPTLQELCVAWSLASKSGVSRHLLAMEGAGLIRRLRRRNRAIEIVRFCRVKYTAQGTANIVGCSA